MLQFPPLPTWDSLHVLIIHFPIALLLLSPLFVLISAVPAPPRGRPYMIGAIVILFLGTLSLFIAGSTGHAAAELAERGGAVDAVLEAHEDLASETQIVFAGLSAILLGMYMIPKVLRCPENRLFATFLPLAFLALYSGGILFLLNTAHAGGRLVHEFGVHALVPATGDGSNNLHGPDNSTKTPEGE
jgi:uncharacterized membrane protein